MNTQSIKEMKREMANGTNQYLVFILNDTRFGINLLNVKEILGDPEFSQVPEMPDYVKGMTSIRGEDVPIVDLKEYFEMSIAEKPSHRPLIVVEGKCRLCPGLLVDAVIGVITVKTDAIEHVQIPMTNLVKDYVAGVYASKEAEIFILNVDKLFSEDTIQLLVH